MARFFVTAIHTDSGKSLASAVLCRALGAAYWKPIQSGAPTDSDTLRQWLPDLPIYPEAYRLQLPASPHAAAAAEGVEISLKAIVPPSQEGDLVIEGAGGLMVPLNDQEFIADLIPQLQAEIVLVSNFYLGSINHSLLTVELLKQRKLPVRGIIFNGPYNAESERIILQHSGYKKLLHIPSLPTINQAVIQQLADELKKQW